MAEARPILYSFRRCPYAIRARLALAAAGLEPGVNLELREVSLQAKPPELLEASPKATVPVLQMGDGTVIGQSLEIMRWALAQADPQGWLAADGEQAAALIAENDGPFKHHLDHFKYAARHGEEGERRRLDHARAAERILARWAAGLAGGGWLLGDQLSLVDWALLPFVRQYRSVDPARFEALGGLAPLRSWLDRFLTGPELAAVLAPPWAARQPWRSPRWLYHLALRHEWQHAQALGQYDRSTRGRSLAEVGFIHASYAHQVAATAERFYAAAGPLVLLWIDPARLAQAGVAVRPEPAPESGELFPHLLGPLPLEAVVVAQAWTPEPPAAPRGRPCT